MNTATDTPTAFEHLRSLLELGGLRPLRLMARELLPIV